MKELEILKKALEHNRRDKIDRLKKLNPEEKLRWIAELYTVGQEFMEFDKEKKIKFYREGKEKARKNLKKIILATKLKKNHTI